MRVKWNRQLDGSLTRRPSEEVEQKEEKNDLECKQKNSPKLFRLFRRKKHRKRTENGGGPDAGHDDVSICSPSEIGDDDSASITSVTTIASQPVTDVCQRDRSTSLFSSFRISFPGGKKKSKRALSSTPTLQTEKNNRYSSPDLRRSDLNGPQELSKSSPSVRNPTGGFGSLQTSNPGSSDFLNPASIPGDFQSLGELRTENSNSLHLLKTTNCVRATKLAKSVSFSDCQNPTRPEQVLVRCPSSATRTFRNGEIEGKTSGKCLPPRPSVMDRANGELNSISGEFISPDSLHSLTQARDTVSILRSADEVVCCDDSISTANVYSAAHLSGRKKCEQNELTNTTSATGTNSVHNTKSVMLEETILQCNGSDASDQLCFLNASNENTHKTPIVDKHVEVPNASALFKIPFPPFYLTDKFPFESVCIRNEFPIGYEVSDNGFLPSCDDDSVRENVCYRDCSPIDEFENEQQIISSTCSDNVIINEQACSDYNLAYNEESTADECKQNMNTITTSYLPSENINSISSDSLSVSCKQHVVANYCNKSNKSNLSKSHVVEKPPEEHATPPSMFSLEESRKELNFQSCFSSVNECENSRTIHFNSDNVRATLTDNIPSSNNDVGKKLIYDERHSLTLRDHDCIANLAVIYDSDYVDSGKGTGERYASFVHANSTDDFPTNSSRSGFEIRIPPKSVELLSNHVSDSDEINLPYSMVRGKPLERASDTTTASSTSVRSSSNSVTLRGSDLHTEDDDTPEYTDKSGGENKGGSVPGCSTGDRPHSAAALDSMLSNLDLSVSLLNEELRSTPVQFAVASPECLYTSELSTSPNEQQTSRDVVPMLSCVEPLLNVSSFTHCEIGYTDAISDSACDEYFNCEAITEKREVQDDMLQYMELSVTLPCGETHEIHLNGISPDERPSNGISLDAQDNMLPDMELPLSEQCSRSRNFPCNNTKEANGMNNCELSDCKPLLNGRHQGVNDSMLPKMKLSVSVSNLEPRELTITDTLKSSEINAEFDCKSVSNGQHEDRLSNGDLLPTFSSENPTFKTLTCNNTERKTEMRLGESKFSKCIANASDFQCDKMQFNDSLLDHLPQTSVLASDLCFASRVCSTTSNSDLTATNRTECPVLTQNGLSDQECTSDSRIQREEITSTPADIYDLVPAVCRNGITSKCDLTQELQRSEEIAARRSIPQMSDNCTELSAQTYKKTIISNKCSVVANGMTSGISSIKVHGNELNCNNKTSKILNASRICDSMCSTLATVTQDGFQVHTSRNSRQFENFNLDESERSDKICNDVPSEISTETANSGDPACESVKGKIKLFETSSKIIVDKDVAPLEHSQCVIDSTIQMRRKSFDRNKSSMIPSLKKDCSGTVKENSIVAPRNSKIKKRKIKKSIGTEPKQLSPAEVSCTVADELSAADVNSEDICKKSQFLTSQTELVINSSTALSIEKESLDFITCVDTQLHTTSQDNIVDISQSSLLASRYDIPDKIAYPNESVDLDVQNEKDNIESCHLGSFEARISNLTLDEVSNVSFPATEEDNVQGQQESGLQERCSSLPLVMGQVRVASPSSSGTNYVPRNCYVAEDSLHGKSRIPKKQAGVRGSSKPSRPPMWLSKAELTQEIQRLGNLCEARTKELNRLKMETKHVSVGFDAFAALFKYMVEDLNGLSVPVLSADLGKTLKQLELAKQDLAYYEREVEELKAHHCQELNDLSNKLFEVFQGEVTELSGKHQEEMDRVQQDHQKQIEDLTSAFSNNSEEAVAKHEALLSQLQQELINQREELQLFQEREIADLEEKHARSSKTLQEHVDQLQKKCEDLRKHSLGMEDAMRKDTDTKLQWVASRKVDLEKEVESLKAVLEMKNKELHTLRVQNLEMEKQMEELPLAREKIKMLQARAEDLEALMSEKTKLERKLCNENQEIKDTYEKEAKVNRRLSMENEELQWRLRQAEQSIISGSFSEVPEYPEDVENGSISPVKSPAPQVLSRSVFFTYVDKDDTSTPRSQYKKITPNFSSAYKASSSPAKSLSAAPSPRRSKSHSEPPQPLHLTAHSTPRKVSRQSSLKQKGSHKRHCPGDGDVVFSSMPCSMTSSISSESSVFEHKDLLLDKHQEQIIESLEILREQRCSSSAATTPCAADDSPTLDGADMSRSAEFSDPKTYYHMAFPVLKEGGDDTASKAASPEDAQQLHSTVSFSGSVDSAEEASREELSLPEEMGAFGKAPPACGDGVQPPTQRECNEPSELRTF